MGHYPCEANELTFILNTNCAVKFETNGGEEPIDSATVVFGEKLSRPQAPEREGFEFDGWYKDYLLTQPWDFENDIVEGNMRLYAKWSPIEIETETETAPVTTEPTTTEPDETQPPESSIETETQPPEEGTQPEKDPGRLPEGQNACRHCGKAAYGQLCVTCSLKLYFLVLLVIVIVFIVVVALYALVTKKATKNELDSDDDAQDPYLTQQNAADDNQQDSEDNQDIDPHNS